MIVIQVDVGSEQDLNKSDTVLGLAEYAEVARSAILKKPTGKRDHYGRPDNNGGKSILFWKNFQ